MRKIITLTACALFAAACDKPDSTTPTVTNGNTNTSSAATTRPDNTGMNARDQAPAAPTAGMQGQGKGDIDLTASIRKRVTDTKMSINAQNVKIITANGKVTLRGPVKDQGEKDQIAAIANEVAGAANVDNMIEIAP